MQNTEIAPEAEAPVEKTPKAFPGALPSIGWIVLYFLLQAICTNIATAMLLGIDKLGSQAALLANPEVLILSASFSAIIQLALMAVYLRKNGRMEQLGLTHFGKMTFGHTVTLAIALVATAMLFNYAYTKFLIPGIKMQAEYAEMMANLETTPLNVVAGIFVVVIAAPVVEELLFRGFLQRAIGNYLPTWAAILISSLAFSSVHGQLYAIPGLMSLSIAFGYLYHRTGSLRTNIILHMANNALALLLTQGMAS